MNENRTSILAIVLSMLAGMGLMHLYENDKTEFAEKYSIISECDKALAEKEIPKNEDIKGESVVNGYLNSAYDKYTYYENEDYSSAESVEWFVNTMPTAYGCGFKIAFNDNGELFFEDVDPDLYASQQGLRTGDKIISIDGGLVADNDFDFAKKLLGKEGTVCNLVIERDGVMKSIDLERHSEKKDYGISYEMYGDTLYVRIKRFGMGVASFIKSDIAEKEYKSIVIDVRNNPGGNIFDAVYLADSFIGDGNVTTHAYNGSTYEYTTKATDDDIKVPMAVLVNSSTASSAEILTALLKQYGNATIIGEKTFGKGIYQEEMKLSDGGTLHYTNGYYTVGDWECYHGKGIYPDVEIRTDTSLIGTDDDKQLSYALEFLGTMH